MLVKVALGDSMNMRSKRLASTFLGIKSWFTYFLSWAFYPLTILHLFLLHSFGEESSTKTSSINNTGSLACGLEKNFVDCEGNQLTQVYLWGMFL